MGSNNYEVQKTFVGHPLYNQYVLAGYQRADSYQAAGELALQLAGIPQGTWQSAYFSVPEGEVGQITNWLSTIGHASNPAGLLSISGLRSLMDDTIQSLKQTFALAVGHTSAWTVIHVDTAAKVYALEQAGGTPYATKAEAQAQASASNRNVSQSGAPGVNVNFPSLGGINTFLGALSSPHTWLRVAEFIIGGVLIAVALNAILKQTTGVDVGGAVVGAAKKVPI
jgi:hypothetical protein